MKIGMEYLFQKANPYVSLAVLAGGLVSAVILFFLGRFELGAEAFAVHAKLVTTGI